MDPQRRLHLRQIHAVGTHFVNRENRLILRTDQPQQFKHIFSAFQQRMENPQRIALFSGRKRVGKGEDVPLRPADHRIFDVLRRDPLSAVGCGFSDVVDQIIQRVVRFLIIISRYIDKITAEIRIEFFFRRPKTLCDKERSIGGSKRSKS